MPQPLTLMLTPEQQHELEDMRDHETRPYLRERAAALLKLAAGQSGLQIAQHGLLKARDPDTLYSWVHRYQAEGRDGLLIRKGRGRKPAFFPLSTEQAQQMLQTLLQRSPQLAGLKRSRWWLDGLRQQVSWLASCTLSAVSRLLRRLQVRYKRGRLYLHSPDPNYDVKLAAITAARQEAQHDPERVRLLYMDELTYYRRPSVTHGYGLRGSQHPQATSGYTRNRSRRIAACLDTADGRVIAWQREHFDRHTLIRFFRAVEAAYPDAERLYIALDNWSVHFHADLLAALSTSKITLLSLPTYAPWNNPVEKLWRRLYQECLHLHPFADDWTALQTAVESWLDQWVHGSTNLLRYVGLLPT